MGPEELNEIFFHNVQNSGGKQAYIHGWDFEGRSYKDTCNMCEPMEIAEAIYK